MYTEISVYSPMGVALPATPFFVGVVFTRGVVSINGCGFLCYFNFNSFVG